MGCAEEPKKEMKQLVRWSLNFIAPCMCERELIFLKIDYSCVLLVTNITFIIALYKK